MAAPPLCSGRACLHTAFIAFSGPVVCGCPLNVHESTAPSRGGGGSLNRISVEYVQLFTMEDSTLYHVYHTPWALPWIVLARSCGHWSVLRHFTEAESELRSASDDSLDKDPLTRSDDVLRHVQSVLHPQLLGPSELPPGGGGGGGALGHTGCTGGASRGMSKQGRRITMLPAPAASTHWKW